MALKPRTPPTAAEWRTMFEVWNPDAHPVSCSNCLHARVGYPADDPVVRCARGYGSPAPLWRLIRRKQPRGFRAASKCPSFTSMSEDA